MFKKLPFLLLLLIFTKDARADIQMSEQLRGRNIEVRLSGVATFHGQLSCLKRERRLSRRGGAVARIRIGERLIRPIRARKAFQRLLRKESGMNRREVRQALKRELRPKHLRTICNAIFNHGLYEDAATSDSERDSQECSRSDLDNNGTVDSVDLLILLQNWGKNSRASQADLNGDGVVDHEDLHIIFGAWGKVKDCQHNRNPLSPLPDNGKPGHSLNLPPINPAYNPAVNCGETGRIFYISESLGNDSWSGLLAEPNGTHTDGPKRTLSAANSVLRSSAEAGDCVLLRRGDIWKDHQASSSIFSLGGVQGSKNSPVVIGAYGPTSSPAPVLDIGGTISNIITASGNARYIVVRDLKLTTTAPLGSRPKGVRVIQCAGESRPEYIVFDSLEISDLTYGLQLQSNHLVLKNSIVRNNFKIFPEESSMGHTQGLYVGDQCNGGSDVHILNNIFDNNGAKETWYDWNAYLSCRNCVFSGNYVTDGSAGLKVRRPSNVRVTDNIFIDSESVAVSVGSDSGNLGKDVLIERNLIGRTRDGITVKTQSSGEGPMENLIIRNNILFDNIERGGADYRGYLHVASLRHASTRIENNTLFNIRHKSAIHLNNNNAATDGSVGLTITNNIIHMGDSNLPAVRIMGGLAPTVLDNNLYDTGVVLRMDGNVAIYQTLNEARLALPDFEIKGFEGNAGLELQADIRGLIPRLTAASEARNAARCLADMPEDFFRSPRPSVNCDIGAEEYQF